MYHEMATAPEIGDWLGDAEDEPLDEMQTAAPCASSGRVYTNMTCLSSEFVSPPGERPHPLRAALARSCAPTGDWKGFLPAFEGVVAIVREEAAAARRGARPRALRRDDGAV